MKKGILAAGSVALGFLAGAVSIGKLEGNTMELKEKERDKYKEYYNMLNQWLLLKLKGKSLENYFVDNNYKNIAIYGMGEMGNRLYEELKNTSIEIKYAVDQDVASTYSELYVFEKDSHLEKVDVMVITAIYAFDEIEKEMKQKVDFPIVSLKDVIYEL